MKSATKVASVEDKSENRSRILADSDLDPAKVGIILRESFRKVGYFFVPSVDCGIEWDSRLSQYAVNNVCKFFPLKAKARKQGEQLFRFLLTQDRSKLIIRRRTLKIVAQNANKVDSDASSNVQAFLEKGLTPPLVQHCLEVWDKS